MNRFNNITFRRPSESNAFCTSLRAAEEEKAKHTPHPDTLLRLLGKQVVFPSLGEPSIQNLSSPCNINWLTWPCRIDVRFMARFRVTVLTETRLLGAGLDFTLIAEVLLKN